MNELWIARDGESAGAVLQIFLKDPEWSFPDQCWMGATVATIDYHGMPVVMFPALLPGCKAKLVLQESGRKGI